MIYPKSLWELTTTLAAYQEEYGKAVDALEDQMETIYEDSHAEVAKLVEKYKKKLQTIVEQSTLSKIVTQVTDIQKEMQAILGGGTPDLVAMGIDLGASEETATKGLDANDPIASFEEAVAKLNIALRDLSTIDLEAMTPPEVIEKSGHGKSASFTITGGVNAGTYTMQDMGKYSDRSPEGIAGAVCIVWALCQEVRDRAGVLQSKVAEACDTGDWECFFDDCASEWCAQRRLELQVSRDALYAELYDGGARAVDPAFFQYYESARDEACDPYITHPFDGFKERIELGNALIDMHGRYTNWSRFTDSIDGYGNYDVPLLLDLKKCGNLFTFVQEKEYDEKAIAFVHQVILQFLASAPVGKMKLCLVDVENKFSLSPYKILDKVDPSILFKGIIRDDRQLEDIIKDMEQIMYRISDDVLSYNGVANIFEYNEKFPEHAEPLHLLVLVNYTKNMDPSIVRRIENIMKHGNRCGIYTLVTTCDEVAPLTLEDVEQNNPLFRSVIDDIVFVEYSKEFGTWITSGENQFTPACETVGKDKVSISRLPALVEQMLGAKE